MRQKLFATLMALGLASSLAPRIFAQVNLWTPPYTPYVVNGVIDATNIYIPPGNIFEYGYYFATNSYSLTAFTPSDTLNWTNEGGTMVFSPGVDFQNYPASVGDVQPAANFINKGGGAYGGLIEFGSILYYNWFHSYEPYVVGKVVVNVTNQIVNAGKILGDPYCLVKFTGRDIDLTGGTIDLSQWAPDFPKQNTLGWLDGYWGTSNTVLVPSELRSSTPLHVVTNRNYIVGYQQLAYTPTKVYEQDWTNGDGSNVLRQIVILNELNPAFSNTVAFSQSSGIIVQWQWNQTNWPSGDVSSNNYLILYDDFGEVTNQQVGQQSLTVGAVPGSHFPNGASAQNPTYIPITYGLWLTSVPNNVGTVVGSTLPGNLTLPSDYAVTNQCVSYEAIFTPQTSLPSDITGGNVTNVAGRIELNASGSLNLTDARITSPNYVLLRATNQYVPSPSAQIATPYAELFLRITNGSFTMSNFVAPYLNHLSGNCDLWSGRWTNMVTNIVAGVSTNAVTNNFHVLVVNSSLNTTLTPQVQTLNLSIPMTNTAAAAPGGDLFIGDTLMIANTLQLDARSLTLTPPDLFTGSGGGIIDVSIPGFSWPDTVPNLQYLTNWGQILDYYTGLDFANAPYNRYATNQTAYQAIVNEGDIFGYGVKFWARYFQNSGIVQSYGPILLRQSEVGCLAGGMTYTYLGDIDLMAGSMLVSNHTLTASNSIDLTASNMLSDGVPNLATLGNYANRLVAMPAASSSWTCYGLSLPVKPLQGDLLGTIINAIAYSNQTCSIVWAGTNRDPGAFNPANGGFLNNAAVGGLILDGLDSSSKFQIQGPDTNGSYALYVDYLELQGYAATNNNASNAWNALHIASNMKVYFAQAVAGGGSIAEYLNGQQGGRLIWASSYNDGYFSSTNITYPSGAPYNGQTYRLNAALAQSGDLVSNTNLPPIYNYNNPAPVWPVSIWSPTATDTPVLPTVVLTNRVPQDPNPPPRTPTPTNASTNTFSFPAASSGTDLIAAGSYNGIFFDTNNGVSPASAGYFTATTTARSNFTAKIMLRGRAYSFSGRFDPATGSYTSSKPIRLSATESLTARLQLDVTKDQIRGTFSNAVWLAELVADRLVYGAFNPASVANYTMIIPPATNSAGLDGYSFGTVKLNAAGRIQWSGVLADGSKVTQASALSKDHYWPMFASLYGGKGLVVDWMQVSNRNLGGVSVWVRPPGVTAKAFSGSFTNLVKAAGAPYRFQAGSKVLNLTQGKVTLTNGPLKSAVQSVFTLDNHNHAKGAANKLSLSLNTASGLFSGSVSIPGRITFQGALFPGSTNGFGFFLNSGESGAVYLNPAP